MGGPTMSFPGAGLVEFAPAGGIARTQVTIAIAERHKIAPPRCQPIPNACRDRGAGTVARRALFERLKKSTLGKIESFIALWWRAHFSTGVQSGCDSVAGSWLWMQSERLSVERSWASSERRYFSGASMADLYPAQADDATPGELVPAEVIATGEDTHRFQDRPRRPSPAPVPRTRSLVEASPSYLCVRSPTCWGETSEKSPPSELDRAFPQEVAGALVEGASLRRQSHGSAPDAAGATGAVLLAAVRDVARGRSQRRSSRFGSGGNETGPNAGAGAALAPGVARPRRANLGGCEPGMGSEGNRIGTDRSAARLELECEQQVGQLGLGVSPDLVAGALTEQVVPPDASHTEAVGRPVRPAPMCRSAAAAAKVLSRPDA